MQTSRQEFQSLTVSQLIDLFVSRASELLKAADSGEQTEVTRISAELRELYSLIKAKREESRY